MLSQLFSYFYSTVLRMCSIVADLHVILGPNDHVQHCDIPVIPCPTAYMHHCSRPVIPCPTAHVQHCDIPVSLSYCTCAVL
jgi:hypothetical protein